MINVEYRGTLDKDPKWGKFSLTLAPAGSKLNAEGKVVDDKGQRADSIFHLLCVPLTSNNLYADETAPRMADRFSKFMNGLGVACEVYDYRTAVQSSFGNPKALVGKKINVYVGYEKDHIGFTDGKYFVADRKGNPHKFEGNSFEDREQAEGKALAMEIDTDKAFLRVLKVKSATVSAPTDAGPAEAAAPALEDGDY